MSSQPLNRSFYLFGIFFLGLYIIISFFQDLTLFQLQDEIYRLPSVTDWFVVSAVISLIATLILLKYYQQKKYWFAFSGGLLSTLTSLVYWIILYNILEGGRLQDYYFPSYLALLIAGLPYALSLIFSRAGNRFWLRAAGVYMLIPYY